MLGYYSILLLNVALIACAPSEKLDDSFFEYKGDDSGSKPMESDVSFEGDLRIPKEVYEKYYEKNGESKRDAIRDTAALWPYGEVHYRFADHVSQQTKDLVRESMDYIEGETCLRFLAHNDNSNSAKITFQTNDYGCYSNSIGRARWYDQVINLDNGCVYESTIIHEILHGIGFWHEQSRPDRDDYIEIVWDKIKDGREHNFEKRTYSEVNHHGSVYDYASVMHYHQTAFLDRPCVSDCFTIKIKNQEEYEKQGRPILGWQERLSSRDIEQINRMYSCSDTGIKGTLEIHVQRGVDLTNGNLFVKVTALSSSKSHTADENALQTDDHEGTDVTWDQKLLFGDKEWLLFRIQVWDEDGDEVTLSETVPVEEGTHTSLKHCQEPDKCDSYVTYDYTLQMSDGTANPCTRNPCLNGGTCNSQGSSYICDCTEDYEGDNCQLEVDSCTSSPCLNGGTCDRQGSSYTCDCTEDYEGDNCQLKIKKEQRLIITARYGVNLPNLDTGGWKKIPYTWTWWGRNYTSYYYKWEPGLSDPYIKVRAIDKDGVSIVKRTTTKTNNANPVWNEELDFGAREWETVHIQVFDYDKNDADDAMSGNKVYSYADASEGIHTGIRINCMTSGYVIFDYSLEPAAYA